eukprot:XP_013972390.1 neural proliferation differentiation and control protein 1 isoform X4 [Canis lupus familiaris]
MATPVPPPSPRHLRLLRLLLCGLVLGAALRGASAGRPDAAACPGSLDCALKRRARCPPGAHVCGPCLQPFQEDPQGLCVPRMRRPVGESLPRPRLEDEIDFLAQELAHQEPQPPMLAAQPQPDKGQQHLEPVLIVASSVAGAAAVAVAALCWCRLQRDIRLTQKADYAAPQAPGSPATPGISPGDQRLAHSAEMYHYQHQRQQMRCLER